MLSTHDVDDEESEKADNSQREIEGGIHRVRVWELARPIRKSCSGRG